jgi:hypothetical protein
LSAELVPFHPQFSVNGPGAFSQKGQVALVDLRQHFVRRTGEVHVCGQAMMARDLAEYAGVVCVSESACPSGHAQVLKAVFGQHA